MTEKLRIVPMRGWIAYHEGFGSSSACAIGNSDGDVVAMAVTRGQGFDVPAAKPMAQRIVACYNACAGIPTEQLESDFAQGYEPWGDVQYLRAQRDELLAALRLAVLQNSHDMLLTGEEIRFCESTIAKALGTA